MDSAHREIIFKISAVLKYTVINKEKAINIIMLLK
jgi:hypothetical protein